ncbi:N-formylglutamate amidohydrolase [Sedimentitalea todarodis]|uniref:N-formylglutamate amidohydrolase n=1 Tax=Sedimentitalea todarodis TaxID=1631240 RepID=A0ABU3VGJ5_9RHOB|nr:N-formylglutamate amidohydrolase [Sedimentitalea todarodis]MDU9005312.1 N-formylglutamate amidohydrolase [Sedimentitalea todarodis]
MKTDAIKRGFLCSADPDPVEWVNSDSTAPVLLVCEHAGQAVPAALGDLGLPPGAIDGHIGWDIGAKVLACALAYRLDAPLVIQRYSRLVIDCNRPPDAPGSVPEVSDNVTIPANLDLTAEARRVRRREVFDPLDHAIEQGFAKAPRRAAFSVHSYTPHLGGLARNWHAGFLSRRDSKTAQIMLDHIVLHAPNLTLAVNQPYQIDDETDWFLPVHAEPRGIAHTLIEVRNDLLTDPDGTARWADLLAGAITEILECQK